MTTLGRITIMNSASLLLARRKMLRLCKLLGYDQFHATRLATSISEIGQHGLRADGHIGIVIKLEEHDERVSLRFTIQAADIRSGLAGIEFFFDAYETAHTEQNRLTIKACKYLPDHIIPLLDNRINRVREMLSTLTQEELLSDLRHNNEALRRRTADLDTKIEELTRTRNELIQSEKMASLGRLVAGFAHEINTPIGVAVGAASTLEENARSVHRLLSREEVDEEEFLSCTKPMLKAAKLAQSNLRRAARLVTSFKRTAIDQSSESQRLFNIDEIITDVINSLHNQFKRTSIEIKVNCPKKIAIFGNPGELDQLLTNLLMNSLIHGYDNGAEAGRITLSVSLEKGVLRLRYCDDGKGMDKEQLANIFEPFFTTNRHNGGSGLGLYICYNLVTVSLEGTIHCDSSPGNGVRFQIRIPVLSEDESG